MCLAWLNITCFSSSHTKVQTTQSTLIRLIYRSSDNLQPPPPPLIIIFTLLLLATSSLDDDDDDITVLMFT